MITERVQICFGKAAHTKSGPLSYYLLADAKILVVIDSCTNNGTIGVRHACCIGISEIDYVTA